MLLKSCSIFLFSIFCAMVHNHLKTFANTRQLLGPGGRDVTYDHNRKTDLTLLVGVLASVAFALVSQVKV